LDAQDKTRLEKLLGMLSSTFDGERATAAAMIARMAQNRKQTINELIAEAMAPKIAPHQAPPPPPNYTGPDFTDISDNHLMALRQLVGLLPQARFLTPWEVQFVTDVASRYEHDYELSEKQLVIVQKILRKSARAFT
jgi:hypothetical protein